MDGLLQLTSDDCCSGVDVDLVCEKSVLWRVWCSWWCRLVLGEWHQYGKHGPWTRRCYSEGSQGSSRSAYWKTSSRCLTVSYPQLRLDSLVMLPSRLCCCWIVCIISHPDVYRQTFGKHRCGNIGHLAIWQLKDFQNSSCAVWNF